MPKGREVSRPSESLPLDERLRRRADYRRCYEQGRRRFGTHLTLFFSDNRLESPRLGMTVSRKVGKAVVRTKLKRRFREIYRRWPLRRDLPALDLVVHAKPSSAKVSFSVLESDLIGQLEKLVRNERRS